MAKTAKGASRTLTEATKTLTIAENSPFTPEHVQSAVEAILANLEAVKHIKDGRNEYKEVSDDATRQRAAEVIIRLGCGETTRTVSETEAQSEEDDKGKSMRPALPPLAPDMERRILTDRLAALEMGKS